LLWFFVQHPFAHKSLYKHGVNALYFRMPSITLHIARHGQTALNREQRFQGSTDAPLDETGLAQAEAMVHMLPPGITRIIASPLQRAQQTALCAARLHKQPVLTMSEFRERDYGVFEGLNREELEARHASIWHAKIVQKWDQAPPGAETMREVRTRVEAGIARLHAEHAGETILLVAHGFIARMLHFLHHKLPEEQFYALPMMANTELASYTLEAPVK
jgi:broad specificity phosphatase PhoE